MTTPEEALVACQAELDQAKRERDSATAQLGIATARNERLARPLLSLIETVECTGGIKANLDPVGAPDWHDIGEAYAEACSALEVPMKYEETTDEET